jgi:integrase
MKLDIRTIKKLEYTKTAKTDPNTGKSIYPKQIIWDEYPPGFGLRVFPSGKKSFVYQYRNLHGQKKLATIANFGELTLEQAKVKAQELAMEVIDGKDPLDERQRARAGTLVADLCSAYIERHAKARKKSWKLDEGRNRIYILPALGTKQIQHIRKQDIAALHDRIGRGDEREPPKPIMANRVREQLSKMFELAKTWGFVDETFINPAAGIEDFEEHERSEYIKPQDMPILAAAIERETNEIAKCAIWMYIFTGKRKNELLQAKWQNVDETSRTLKIEGSQAAGSRNFSTTKGGEVEFLALSDEAFAILERLKHCRVVGNPHIFPGKKAGQQFVNIRKPWERIKKDAMNHGARSVEKVTIHGLRHTAAVWLTNLRDADLGLVRKILNQKSLLATKKYAKYKSERVRTEMIGYGKLVKEISQTRAAEVISLKKTDKKVTRTKREAEK